MVDQFAGLDGTGQLVGVVAPGFGSALRADAGRLLLQQPLQPLAGNRLEQGARHPQAVRPGQALGALQDALVLAADQHQGACIAQAYQVANELDAVHLGHLQVAEDQIDAAGLLLQMLDRDAGPLAGDDLPEA
ncbi:hypothetical protein D3C81_1763130 [compost metagenome]